MNSPSLARVEALFHEMQTLPAHERSAALRAVRAQDPALAAEVQALLDQPELAGPLSAPALDAAARLLPREATSGLAGKRLGAFEVQGLLGVGGMGEVYRAHDPRLERDVAIKVLPSAVSSDPDRMARFRREARVLAALNHPNIAAIHGLEEADGRMFLVMELVEGEDLADRLGRGPIPIEQAIAMSRQIAEGLEEAHEKGIVHRDLKPANIKVKADGGIKILDFGLAKAYTPEATRQPASEVSESPTRTQATRAGMVLGTAAYMAPEQARGAAVDRRADIWSFGVVLFEMLSGTSLFKGETPSDSLAAVLKTEPDWARLPAATPPRVEHLIRRCLDRDPKRRLQSIGEARIVLGDLPGPGLPEPSTPSVLRRIGPWLAAAAFAVLLWLVVPRPSPPESSISPKKLLVHLGAEASLSVGWGPAAVVSPDGKTLAFVAEQSERSRLFVRRLDQLQATVLPGTEDAAHPFFSPDGQWVGFFADGKLKKIAVSGGPAITLCDAPRGRGGAWGDDGSIVFAPNILIHLQRVSAAGGVPVPVGTDGDEVGTHRWPQILPRGRAIVFTRDLRRVGPPAAFEGGDVVVAPVPSGTPKVIVHHAYFGRYLPSGHLIYVQKDRLLAVRFDLDRLEVVGQAVPILEKVGAFASSGGAQVSFSSDGTLVYLPESFPIAPIEWVAQDGTISTLRATPSDWKNPQFSPDGKRLALDISDGTQRDIYVYEWERDTLTPLTFDPGDDSYPVWSPDGRRILFSSDRGQPGFANLYWMNADGTNEAQRLTRSQDNELAGSWHPTGKWVSFWNAKATYDFDLRMLPVEDRGGTIVAAGPPFDFLSSPVPEVRPVFSPDGRWVAYTSDESGSPEVYVRPFPGPGGKWKISSGGGWFPRWAAHEPRLMFVNLTRRRLMYAEYNGAGQSFRANQPLVWTPTPFIETGDGYSYGLHPDGRRAAMKVDGKGRDSVVFFYGFFDYLRTVLPASKGSER